MFAIYHGYITGVAPNSLAQSGVGAIPILGSVMKSCGAIFVDRENRKSRSDTVQEIKKRVQLKQPVPQISLFPEGTVTNGESLVQFKVGAFIPKSKNKNYSCSYLLPFQVPVQPVAVSFEGWNTAAWGFEGLGWYVFYTLGNFRMKVLSKQMILAIAYF